MQENPPEHRERLQKFPRNLKLFYVTEPRVEEEAMEAGTRNSKKASWFFFCCCRCFVVIVFVCVCAVSFFFLVSESNARGFNCYL